MCYSEIKELDIIEKKCKKLNKEKKIIHEENGKSYTVTLSIGVAIAKGVGNDYKSLCEKADKALYQSKSRGRDTYTIYE